jgi:hypothetical protein
MTSASITGTQTLKGEKGELFEENIGFNDNHELCQRLRQKCRYYVPLWAATETEATYMAYILLNIYKEAHQTFISGSTQRCTTWTLKSSMVAWTRCRE